MNDRENAMAVLRYQSGGRIPVVHFGFWQETLEKWHAEGHLSHEEATGWGDGNTIDRGISRKLGFDFNWYSCYGGNTGLMPEFTRQVLETMPDGSRKVLNPEGMIVLEKDGAGSIPMEIGHTLQDRKAWENLYLPRLQDCAERMPEARAAQLRDESATRGHPLALYCGSLYGQIRNWLGVEGISYLAVDDEDLYDEIIVTVGKLELAMVKRALATGIQFDYAHFWEDICFKNGPLVNPEVFAKKVGPHYRAITEELKRYGIDIVSLDCDGLIDSLIPVWFENGVNTMFPIEVGTWRANIAPWRQEYGRELRGVGGMDKVVFAHDRTAIDTEIERLRPLVDLGGYIPCPDHRIPPDALWDNVRYYCERMRQVFGG